MKYYKYMLLFTACIISFIGKAQTIVLGEFFVNTDPGIGNATPFSITFADTNITQTFTIPATSFASLQTGYHKIYGRVKDNLGQWGHTFRRNLEIIINQDSTFVVKAEYFFGSDPTFGNSSTYYTLNASTDSTWTMYIPTAQLPPAGVTTLRLRVKDSMESNWSHTADTTFTLSFCSAPAQPLIMASDSLCSGQQLTYSIAPVANSTGYQWSLPAGWVLNSGQGTTTITATAPIVSVNTTFAFNVAAYNTCDTGLVQAINIVVLSAPSATWPQILGNICINGAPVTLMDGLPIGGIYSGPGVLGNLFNPSVAGAGTHTLTYSYGMLAGCPSVASQTIIVTPLPVSPSLINGAIDVCNGSVQTYTTASVSSATSYTWVLPAGWSGASTSNSIATTAGVNSGQISVTANNQCGSSAAATLNVLVNDIPMLSGFIAGETIVCYSAAYNYSVNNIIGVDYTWLLPVGWIGNSNTNSIVATSSSSSGIISVSVANNCGIGNTLDVQVTVTQIDTSVTNSNNILTAAEVNAAYQWVDCSNNYTVIPNATNQTFSPTDNGFYAVILNKESCSDTSNCHEIAGITTIESILGNSVFRIYPNPNNGNFTINFPKKIDTPIAMTISNLTGQVLIRHTLTKQHNLFDEPLLPGVYIITLMDSKRQKNIKMVVL